MILIFLMASLQNSFGLPMEPSQLSPEEISGNFEGDMLIDEEKLKALMNTRSGLLDTQTRWPKNADGIVSVPYQIRGGSPFGMLFSIILNSN